MAGENEWQVAGMGNECWTTSWQWVAWEEWRGTIGEGRVVSDECRVTIAAAEMAARMAAAGAREKAAVRTGTGHLTMTTTTRTMPITKMIGTASAKVRTS